ncbi:Putative rhodanese domain-containing dual specificity protein phosphatase [Durusdinium trenchii]|uniref:Rhodanese domain-containing dual specificity protein phosphatase n=1 Tax=Durusdinium trenchii TaxID=1381693 RepID=A0ABP0QP41_9DINO
MSELLDAFDDAGVDVETKQFLIEALHHAEEAQWSDVLEPFVNGSLEACLAALTKPQVLLKSAKALEKEMKQAEKSETWDGSLQGSSFPPAAKEKISPIALAFLQLLHPVLGASGLHTVARCAAVCRNAKEAVLKADVWDSHVLRARRWSLDTGIGSRVAVVLATVVKFGDVFWITEDSLRGGVFIASSMVGECGFQRWLRVGHHSDLRKNSAQLAAYGGRGGQAEWVSYRRPGDRYVRLMPPDGEGRQYAMVLQDPCPREAAEQVLVDGVDFTTHCNPVKSEGLPDTQVAHVCDAERLRKRLCVGQYSLDLENRLIRVSYTAVDGTYRLCFSLKHWIFSDCLTWEQYEMESQTGEVVPFNLGRLPDWKGGGLEDEGKDHFPSMNFRPKTSLEHLA